MLTYLLVGAFAALPADDATGEAIMFAPAGAESTAMADQTPPIVRHVGLGLGIAIFLFTYWLPVPDGMTEQAWRVCGLALWMGVWWITEAMPLPVPALLTLVVMPLTGIMSLKKADASFSADLIFLFLGYFILSIAI